MEDKYLPIGTICSLKNNNKKVMIVSYFSMEYHGKITMYDYKGCVYPEGLLLESQLISFNHNDIENIDYIGFKNEQYDALNRALNQEKEESGKEYDQKNIMSNFKFDENGVVIFDGTATNNDTSNVNSSESIVISNPFVTTAVSDTNNHNQPKDSVFKFDENGVVISDGTVANNQNNASKYRFDENGFVISDETVSSNTDTSATTSYQFDENGTVISDGTVSVDANVPSSSGYRFDENGIVISE